MTEPLLNQADFDNWKLLKQNNITRLDNTQVGTLSNEVVHKQ